MTHIKFNLSAETANSAPHTTLVMSPPLPDILVAQLSVANNSSMDQLASTLPLPPAPPHPMDYTLAPASLRTALGDYAFWDYLIISRYASVRRICAERIPTTNSVLTPVLKWYTTDTDAQVRTIAHARLKTKPRKRLDRAKYSSLLNTRQLKILIASLEENTDELKRYMTDPRQTIRRMVAMRYTGEAWFAWLVLARDIDPMVRRLAAERMAITDPLFHSLLTDNDPRVRAAARHRFATWSAHELAQPETIKE